VRECHDKRTGQRFALKVIDMSSMTNRKTANSEVETLRVVTDKIQHPNLIRIFKVYEEDMKMYIVLELCTGGELYDRLVKNGTYSERQAARLIRQFASAVRISLLAEYCVLEYPF
jgi:calcium-dependent protein kinase